MTALKNPFTATKTQVATYLFGVALFSISFLVFLNASVSFVVTDLIGQEAGVGDAVGTLGFVDELVVIVMCPIWGAMSDKLGVRMVTVSGYAVVGLSLFVFVQARNVYPQLLLGRMLFSIGAAATSTMVTAILPTMTFASKDKASGYYQRIQQAPEALAPNCNSLDPISSEAVAVQAQSGSQGHTRSTKPKRPSTSQVAGLVGMSTGIGALIALGIFLPLPARLGNSGYARDKAVIVSFYIVGSVSFFVGLICLFGLRNLPSEESKGWRNLLGRNSSPVFASHPTTALQRFHQAALLGLTDLQIGLGYLGGFVARASSVGISLFIPLFVNAYFIRTGLCTSSPSEPAHGVPGDVKEHCYRAYTIAAALSGVSQLIALLSAPVFGWLDGRFHSNFNAPLLFAAVAGVVGYTTLAGIESPLEGGGVWICMVLLGISQIGAIVCSLSLLSRGIEGADEALTSCTEAATQTTEEEPFRASESGEALTRATVPQETSALMQAHLHGIDRDASARSQLKGTIAGLYSLFGGAGILLLTKLGGYLFDKASPGAPFYMLAVFNAVLLATGLACSVISHLRRRPSRISLPES